MMRVATEIERRLRTALEPERLSVIDESWRHEGHAGARPEGESHFRVEIVARRFAGASRLERQRMIYAALGDLMTSDVHALAISARAPDEATPPEAG